MELRFHISAYGDCQCPLAVTKLNLDGLLSNVKPLRCLRSEAQLR